MLVKNQKRWLWSGVLQILMCFGQISFQMFSAITAFCWQFEKTYRYTEMFTEDSQSWPLLTTASLNRAGVYGLQHPPSYNSKRTVPTWLRSYLWWRVDYHSVRNLVELTSGKSPILRSGQQSFFFFFLIAAKVLLIRKENQVVCGEILAELWYVPCPAIRFSLNCTIVHGGTSPQSTGLVAALFIQAVLSFYRITLQLSGQKLHELVEIVLHTV